MSMYLSRTLSAVPERHFTNSLSLTEARLEAAVESQTVVEGQDLDLHCAVAGDNTSALEWSIHHKFVKFLIFLNNQQGKCQWELI